MLVKSDLAQVKAKIENLDTFVLNIVAQWCPDCTERQALHLPAFVESLAQAELDVIELLVQQERLVFLSPEHDKFVESLGGHGYPRTILVKDGVVVDADNVEFITEQQLTELSASFQNQL